jgi:hypothetical protein
MYVTSSPSLSRLRADTLSSSPGSWPVFFIGKFLRRITQESDPGGQHLLLQALLDTAGTYDQNTNQ